MIPGLHWVKIAKPGKPVRHYCYAWRGGPLIMKSEGGPRPKLDSAALDRLTEARRRRTESADVTMGEIIARWRKSPEWRAMAHSTRIQWGYKLDAIDRKFGSAPTRHFDDRRIRPVIMEWRDGMADKPRSADYAIQVLQALLAWACERGHLKDNHALGIRSLYKGGQRAHIIWTPEERAVWEGAAEPVRVAFAFACLTGLRRGDLVAVDWGAVQRDAIVWKPAKGQGQVVATIPLLPELRALLGALSRSEGPILRNEHGKPWTVSSLTHAVQRERDRLGLPDKHLHDCRGTFATELCLAGLTDAEIAGILGWGAAKVATIRRVYVDQAATVVQIAKRMAKRRV